MTQEQHELLKCITQVGFALDELVLYLDTHPCDQDALACYEDYKKKQKRAVEEYTCKFGPLHAQDVDVTNYWSWVEGPWPWE